MIFVTIGSQEPFDRLIEAIDNIAPSLNTQVIAQVFRSNYKVRNIEAIEFVSPVDYNDYIEKADLIVAHAGMGTILSVLQLGKPLIVMPRLAKYHETRNNHQVATAVEFEKMGYLKVAFEADSLRNQIIDVFEHKLNLTREIYGSASPLLIGSIKNFIENIAAHPRL
jgi:UDP-N-acetylglucosamine transferase subunit ALG13